MWQNIQHMIWNILPSIMLLLFTTEKDQQNALLSLNLRISLFTCNFCKLNFIHFSSWSIMFYCVSKLQFFCIVSIKGSSSIKTWLGKKSQESFFCVVPFSFAFDLPFSNNNFHKTCRLKWKSWNKRIFCQRRFGMSFNCWWPRNSSSKSKHL